MVDSKEYILLIQIKAITQPTVTTLTKSIQN